MNDATPVSGYPTKTLMLSPSGYAFYRDFSGEAPPDIRGNPQGVISFLQSRIRNAENMLRKVDPDISFQPITRVFKLTGLPVSVGIQAISRESARILLKNGWVLLDHNGKQMTESDLDQPAVSKDEYAKLSRRKSPQKQGNKPEIPAKFLPPERDYKDIALCARHFAEVVKELRSAIPEEERDADHLLAAILAKRRQYSDDRQKLVGKKFTQAWVLWRVFREGTDARGDDVHVLWNDLIKKYDPTTVLTRNQVSRIVDGQNRLPDPLRDALCVTLGEALLASGMKEDEFNSLWHFFVCLPNSRMPTDTKLSLGLEALWKEYEKYGLTDKLVAESQPEPLPGNSKMGVGEISSIRKGKTTMPAPQKLDQLILTLGSLKKGDELLIPRERLAQLAKEVGFPYDPATGYCIDPYEVVFARHLEAAQRGRLPPLSVMLRELRTCRQVNMSDKHPALQHAVGQVNGVHNYECPGSFTVLPPSDALDRILGVYAERLKENGVATPSFEKHKNLFHTALDNGYPDNKSIKYYQAAPHDPWHGFYPSSNAVRHL